MEIKDESVREMLPERFELTELMLESSVREVAEDTIVLNDGREIPYGLAVWAAGNGPIPLTLGLIDDLGPEQAIASFHEPGGVGEHLELACPGPHKNRLCSIVLQCCLFRLVNQSVRYEPPVSRRKGSQE